MGLLKMTPEIEAYKDDYVGWKPRDPVDAQNFYPIIEMMKKLPQHLQPATDVDIMAFMKAYTDAMRDYSGYIPQPQNINKYNNASDFEGSTDSELYDEMIKKVGPALQRGLLKGY